MFRAMFYDELEVSKVELRHFDEGMRGAVSETMASLKQRYQMVIQKQKDDYEEVLWSVADDIMLERQTSEIYNKSYLKIMERRNRRKSDKRPILDQKTFYQRMNRLKTDSHGNILVGSKSGWYQFREQGGVSLRIDHHLAQKPEHKRWITRL